MAKKELLPVRELHILSLGAGVQSTALFLMRQYDAAIFADTGEEPEAVYSHLQWLGSLNRTPILVVQKGRLGDDLMQGVNSTGQRFASIPAYTLSKNGAIGVGRRQCSKEYKVEPINRAIRRQVCGLRPRARIPRHITVHQYIGISLDEAGRAARLKEVKRPQNVVMHFPLLESLWTRTDCLNWLADKVPHQVPRSACVFCPYHSDAEWLRIKANPADWARAVEVDEAMRIPGRIVNRKLDGKLFLHESCQPLVQIQFNPNPSPREQQLSIKMARECMGVCGV